MNNILLIVGGLVWGWFMPVLYIYLGETRAAALITAAACCIPAAIAWRWL